MHVKWRGRGREEENSKRRERKEEVLFNAIAKRVNSYPCFMAPPSSFCHFLLQVTEARWEPGNKANNSNSPLPHSQALVIRRGDKLPVFIYKRDGVDCSQVPVVLLCHLPRLNIPLDRERDTQSRHKGN